jgi:hypothetical protein
MDEINITRYEISIHDASDDFEDILHSLEFRYNAGHLALSGLQANEIRASISKAMKVCRLNGIDTSDHFRSLYIFDEKTGATYCDWRMTRQGFTLVVMNTPATNESIARWQWELINSLRFEE